MILHETNGMCPYVREMMREAKRSAFIRDQKKTLRNVIDHAVDTVDDPKKDYWSDRISAHLNRRLSTTTKAKWVPLLAEFSDTQVYGRIQQEKMKRYLLMARDAAAEEVRKGKRTMLS